MISSPHNPATRLKDPDIDYSRFHCEFISHPEWGTLSDLTTWRIVLNTLADQALLDFHGQQGPFITTYPASGFRMQLDVLTPTQTIERRILLWGLYYSLIWSSVCEDWKGRTYTLQWDGQVVAHLSYSPPNIHPPPPVGGTVNEVFINDIEPIISNSSDSNSNSSASASTQSQWSPSQEISTPQPNLDRLAFSYAWGQHTYSSDGSFFFPLADMLLRAAAHTPGDRLQGPQWDEYGDESVLDANDWPRRQPPFFKWEHLVAGLKFMVGVALRDGVREEWRVRISVHVPDAALAVRVGSANLRFVGGGGEVGKGVGGE